MGVLKRTIDSLKPISEKYEKPVIFFLFDLLWCYIRYGSKRSEYILFDFYKKSGIERSTFYTRGNTKYEKIFNSEMNHDIFWNKAKFNEVFSEFIKRDWLDCSNSTKEEISSFIKSHNKVIAKPIDNEQGIGIHIADINAIDIYSNEDKKTRYILEDYIEQHPIINEINPTSVNSIRVYTIVDKKQNVDILSASLKVGTVGAIVDNAHSDGYAYPIDIETGIICGQGIQSEKPFQKYYYHPNTNIKMIGFEIPHWDQLKKTVLIAACKIPASRLIAWDIAILRDGVEIIEGNYTGGRDLMQYPSGIGMLKRIKKFM
ncbi:MAG: hypothetical protein K5907_08655 [Treponema sp.]|nr:hypothetical protein [Treponema sp.]